MAAAYVLVISAVLYRGVTRGNLREIMLSSVKSSASVGLVIGGALILNYVVASENVPKALVDVMKGMEMSPMLFILGINLLLLALGCILDASTIILLVVPAAAQGIDPIHFGVVVVVNCMIGLVTPPYGVLLFVINGTTGIPLREMIVEIWPFLIVLFPQLVLWLPMMFGDKVGG